MSDCTASSESGCTDADSQQLEELEGFVEVESSEKCISDLSLKDDADACGGSEAEMETKPSEYHGVLVKPLASFGSFEQDLESGEPRWIRDHTSGEVHEDMPTIAFLYSQSLTLPDGAKEFVSQSPKLTEEADWERRKAAFYSFYPQEVQERAFQALSGLSKLEASRLIARKTSHYEHEILLGPLEGSECSPQDEEWLEKDLERLAAASLEKIPSLVTEVTKGYDKLQRSYKAYDTCHSGNDVHRMRLDSSSWKGNVLTLNRQSNEVIDHHISVFQQQHAKPRFEPRTGWIHVKTDLLGPDVDFDSGVSPEILKNPIFKEFLLLEGQENNDKKTRAQINRFWSGWRSSSKDMVGKYDAFLGDGMFVAFDFKVPYSDISPQACKDVLQLHFKFLRESPEYFLPSTPIIQMWEKKYHEMVVYIKLGLEQQRSLWNECGDIGSILTPKENLKFCSNCFCDGHSRTRCRTEIFGFAQ